MGNATAWGLWCICYCSDGVDTFSVNKFLCRVFQNPLVGSPCMSSMSIEPTANELDLKEEVWQLSISSVVVDHLPISNELTVISGCLQWVTIQLSSPTLETSLLKWPCEQHKQAFSVLSKTILLHDRWWQQFCRFWRWEKCSMYMCFPNWRQHVFLHFTKSVKIFPILAFFLWNLHFLSDDPYASHSDACSQPL
jgi:hypothetical protein